MFLRLLLFDPSPNERIERLVSSPEEDMTDKLKDSQPAEAKRLPARVRHAHLVDAARKRGFLQVTDIAAEIGVSEMTIRRDLVELERGGLLVRTHGGAVIDEEAVPETFLDREEPAFSARLREYNPEK